MTWPVGMLWLLQTAVWGVAPTSGENPTVGDTVLIERFLEISLPSASVRLLSLEVSELVEPLGLPEVVDRSGGVIVRYAVALFASGRHAITMPDIDVVHPDGTSETLVGGVASVEVVSLVPDGDERPNPKPARNPIERGMVDSSRAVLLLLAVFVVSLVCVAIRRRPRSRPRWEPVAVGDAADPVPSWLAAGEPRAISAFTMNDIRTKVARMVPGAALSLDVDRWIDVIAKERPDWPTEELRDLMHSLERASFAPAVPSDIIALSDESSVLLESLESLEAMVAPEPVSD